MKTSYKVAALCLPLLAAGCATDEPRTRYGYNYDRAPVYTGSTSTIETDADPVLASVVRRQFERYGALNTLAQNIEIKARNGTITLSGTVPGEQERRMIHAMVENTKGVLAVDDRLRVTSPTPLPFDQTDRALIDRVKQGLQKQPATSAFLPNIGVSADAGIVTLTGSVPTESDRLLVENIVKNTAGVAGVIDRIQAPLSPTGRIEPSGSHDAGEIFSLHVQGLTESDRTLAQRILQGLRTDTAFTSLLPVVDIHVADGRVNLRGTVQSEEQRRTIVSAVRRAAGADNVVDEIRVVEAR